MKYAHILARFASTPWALMPDKLAEIVAFMSLKASGGAVSETDLATLRAASEAKYAGVRGSGSMSGGGVAVLPMFGVMSQRMDMLSEISGGVSLERVSATFDAMVADESVGTIVLNMDTPGGSVYGTQEFADKVAAQRGQKKVVAVANSLIASAGYWVASQADELIVTPGGEVGSIGVLTVHQDMSKMLEAEGVSTTIIHAGKYKVEGNPFGPLNEEAAAAVQSRVDEYYAAFTKAVAKGRGVAPSAVRGGFGEGRVVGAQESVSLGMADRVDTLEAVIAKLRSGPRAQSHKRRAQATVDMLNI